MHLHEIISAHFDLESLEDLCKKLDVPFEDLRGSARRQKALALQEYMQARFRSNQLLTEIHSERPLIDLSPFLYLLVVDLYPWSPGEVQLNGLFESFGLQVKDFIVREHLAWGSSAWRKDKAQKLQKYMEENGRSADLLNALQQKGANVSFYQLPQEINPDPQPPPVELQTANYLAFDIRLTPQGDGKYTSDVLDSPRSQKKEKDRELNLTSVETLLKFLRNKGAAPAHKVEELGQLLCATLFPPPIMEHLTRSLEKAKDTGHEGMRVRLRFSLDQADLLKLPWEYCHDGRSYLALSPSLPFVRYLETATSYKPVDMPKPVKILVAIASPSDYAKLKVEDEVAWIRAALQDLEKSGKVQFKIIEHTTSFELFRQVHLDFKPHILHFIGHGDFDNQELGSLALEDGKVERKAQLFNTKDLLQLLAPSAVKLVFLSACLTAAYDSNDALMGIAPTLVVGNEVDGHIPAVVGMQFPVPDQTAILFSRLFYESIAQGEPLDAAITKARMGVYFSGVDRVFWGIPVLFMRAKDGAIWQKNSRT